jgi:predicted metal-dependent hydrolase
MGIVLKCPAHAQEDRVNLFLKRKWMWLTKQLKFFAKFQRTVYEREHISGESFIYLGRQYELIVKRGKNDRVSLTKGKLVVTTKRSVEDSRHNKYLIEKWYQKRAEEIFQERFSEIFERFGYKDRPELSLRKMNKRWGSFMGNKKIILNPRLISASKECIDYVITHELCHMRYKNHNKAFFRHLKSRMPDWEKRKDRLEGYLI